MKQVIVDVYRDNPNSNHMFVANVQGVSDYHKRALFDIVECVGMWASDGTAYLPEYINTNNIQVALRTGRYPM